MSVFLFNLVPAPKITPRPQIIKNITKVCHPIVAKVDGILIVNLDRVVVVPVVAVA